MLLPLAVLLTLAFQQKAAAPRVVYDIEIAPDDQWMAVTNSTDDIYIFSLGGKLLHTLHHKTGSHLVDIEISPDGNYLACSNLNFIGDYCPMWSTRTWKENVKIGVWNTRSYCDFPSGIEYGDNGKYVLGQTANGHELVVWNAATGAVAYQARKTRLGGFAFAVTQNAAFVVLRESLVADLRFWDIESTGRFRQWGDGISGIPPKALRNMKFSHDGRRLFIITQPQPAYCNFNIYKPDGGKTVLSVQDAIDRFVPRDVAWSGDDRLIFSSGMAGQIVSFDPSSGHLKTHWTGHGGLTVHAIAATHHGHTVVSGARDVCVWNGDSGRLIRTFKLP
jgi:WD40 repeat protein